MPKDHRRNDPVLISRLKAAVDKRGPLRSRTNALRLVNGSGDSLDGLILEQFDLHFSAQIFAEGWLTRVQELTDFVRAAFKARYFILKDRTATSASRPDAIKNTILIDDGAGAKTVVQEYGITFEVDLNDGLNCGLFLDMRAHRQAMGTLAKHKRVLNCFAYTCSFGVHARLGGASEVVNVDVSKKILERGQANYTLNGISWAENEFLRAEAGAYIERAVKKENRFDMIILDPPSFARAGSKVFQVKKELPGLLANAVNVLNPGGILFVSTNFTGLGLQDLKKMLTTAAPGRKIQKITPIGQDTDFPGTNTFKESYLTGLWAVWAERF